MDRRAGKARAAVRSLEGAARPSARNPLFGAPHMAFLLHDVFYDGALIGRQRHVIYVVVAAISISKGTDCARRFEAVTRVLYT